MTRFYNLKKLHLLFTFLAVFSVCISSAFSGVVRVVVTSRSLIRENKDNGIEGLIRLSYVEHGKAQYNLGSDFRLKPKTAKQLDLILEEPNGDEFRPELPEFIKDRFLQYLIYGPTSSDFDCMSFAQYLNGLEFKHGTTNFRSFMDQNWIETLFDLSGVQLEQSIHVGQVIILATPMFESYTESLTGCCGCGPGNLFGKAFKSCAYVLDSIFPNLGWTYKHWAIYLGKGLYLSKGGIDAPLIVTNLESMKKIFEADSVIILERKPSFQSRSDAHR
jgi:hypothetical protein